MGDIQQQIISFHQRLEALSNDAVFADLSSAMSEIANPLPLLDVLQYVKNNIGVDRLASYYHGYGEMFLRKDTGLLFSFFVGRDRDNGEFKFILTPNGKKPNGEPGIATDIHKGTFKVGKLGVQIDAEPEDYYRLTLKNKPEETQAEIEFSELINSPFVGRYMASAPYNKTGNAGDDKVALFMKHATAGDLWHALHGVQEVQKYFNELEKLVMTYTILASVRHIHNAVHPNHPMRHRDIKTLNKVVMPDGRVLIIDFGAWNRPDRHGRTYDTAPPEYMQADVENPDITMAKSNYRNSYAKTFWAAVPEDERKKWELRDSGARADVWATGVSIFELYKRQYPTHTAVQDLDEGRFGYLKSMLTADPTARCNSDQALQYFIQALIRNYPAATVKAWLNKMLQFYTNDFHRMQFFSELLNAGCGSILNYLTPEQIKKISIEQLLSWPYKLTISEWLRLRAYYKLYLTNIGLQKFNGLLFNRPEFSHPYVNASFFNAVRVNDVDVLNILHLRGSDVSFGFKRLAAMGMSNNVAALGFYPWNFPGRYAEYDIKPWLEKYADVQYIVQLLTVPINIRKLSQLVKMMLHLNYMQPLLAAIVDLLRKGGLTLMVLSALQNAGMSRAMIRDYLLVERKDEQSNDLDQHLNATICTWIGIVKDNVFLTAKEAGLIGLHTLLVADRELFYDLNLNLPYFLEFVVQHVAINQEFYFRKLLEFGVDIWEHVAPGSNFAAILRQYNELNCQSLYLYLQSEHFKKTSIINILQVDQLHDYEYSVTVINALIESDAFSAQTVDRLLQCGMSRVRLAEIVISANIDVIPVLVAGGINLLNYIHSASLIAGTARQKIDKFAELCGNCADCLSADESALLSKKLAYLQALLMKRDNDFKFTSPTLTMFNRFLCLEENDLNRLVDQFMAAPTVQGVEQLRVDNSRWFNSTISKPLNFIARAVSHSGGSYSGGYI